MVASSGLQLLFLFRQLQFGSLVIRRTRKLACYSEKVSFVRAQKMLGSNILRHPPGHCAGFVNEWIVSFFHCSEEKLWISEFHIISSYVDRFAIGRAF